MALDFTLLTEDQIWAGKYGEVTLDVLKKYGVGAAATDLAVLLGSRSDEPRNGDFPRTPEDDCIDYTWTAVPLIFSETNVDIWAVAREAPGRTGFRCYDRNSVRPVLLPSETVKLTPTNCKTGVNDVEIVEYGEYPQMLADGETSQDLESLFQKGTLTQTGKTYTFDSVDCKDHDTTFQPRICTEYEYEGKKYIRCDQPCPHDEAHYLSNMHFPHKDDVYWVKVQPIEWLADPTGTWVSKKALVGGIQFDTKRYYEGDFSKTFIKHYLDTYFAKEIEPSETLAQKREKAIKGLSEKLSEISDLEKLKETITPARTPERTETLARIMRVRKAKEILSGAAQKAHKEGNKKMLRKIIEMAKPYAAREAVVLDKFHQRRAERRAAHSKKDRS